LSHCSLDTASKHCFLQFTFFSVSCLTFLSLLPLLLALLLNNAADTAADTAADLR
jgi:hypothetical protein